jgi:hypothetical protein
MSEDNLSVSPGDLRARRREARERLRRMKSRAKEAGMTRARRLRRWRRLLSWVLYLSPFPLIVVGLSLASGLTTLYARVAVWCILAVIYLSGGVLFDMYLRRSRWNRLKRGLSTKVVEQQRRACTKQGAKSIAVHLGIFLPVSVFYLWSETFVAYVPGGVQKAMAGHGRGFAVSAFITAYLLGLGVRDVFRYRFRMFAAPLTVACILLLCMLVVLVAPEGTQWVHEALTILSTNAWLIAFFAVVLIWRPQITRLLPRVQKAELPGGAKFEIDKIDELQRSLNPWKKTVSRFADLMQWVAELIEETGEEDTVKFLAYTPALGFLTRPDKDWRRLHKLLIERNNVQIICLRQTDLEKWHQSFLNKRTVRPEGIISQALIKKANNVSELLLSDKRRQYNPSVKPVIEKSWDQMPGYYLFANSKRAIIAAPLFLPGDPKKGQVQDDADGYLRNTPVKMLGFESNDNWTVWMVNEVCDHYARTNVGGTRDDLGEASHVVSLGTLEACLKNGDATKVMQPLLEKLTSSYEKAMRESPARFAGAAACEVELVLRMSVTTEGG